MNSLSGTILAAVIGAAFMSPAQAVTKYHDLQSGPVARCQSAAATYDASLARKALALQNIGTASIFVTCAFEFERIVDHLGPSDTPIGFNQLDIYFTSQAPSAVTVKCTAVSGYETGSNQYSSKSVLLTQGAQDYLMWSPSDFPLGFDGLIAATCLLPPGAAINDSHLISAFEDETDPPST
jgi:hypothetical protein